MCMRRSASHETTAHKITNAVSARRHKTRGQRSRSALNARKNTPSLKNGRETCKICSYERLEEEKNKPKKRGCTSSASVQIHSNTFCHITYYIYLCGADPHTPPAAVIPSQTARTFKLRVIRVNIWRPTARINYVCGCLLFGGSAAPGARRAQIWK